MNDIKFVTSFSKQGYALYGRRFLETALEHLPGEIHVYYEGKNPSDITDERLHYHDLFQVPGVAPWLQALVQFPMFRGESHGKRNYRYDAFRFTRKIFAQCDAAADYDGLLFWIDADTEFTADVPELWLRELLEDHFIAYMDRPSWHLCASFVGWNTRHPQNDMFWLRYWNLMQTGEFAILPEWHDSYILAMMIEGLELEANDIAANLKLEDGPINVFDVVFEGKGRHFKGIEKFGPQRYNQLINLVGAVKPMRIIEIGTWNGDRAIQMAAASSPVSMEYIGFDLFEHATDETDQIEKNVKPHFTAKDVSDKLAGHNIKAELVVGNTNETFPRWISENPDKKAGVVYIDGGHSVDTIRQDFHNALQVVEPGGYIVLDDWYEDGIDTDQFGCNRVLEESGYEYQVMPIADPVKDGGVTKMAVVIIEDSH